MKFDEELQQFIYDFNGLIFAWDEEPETDDPYMLKKLADNYFSHLDTIIEFMMPDLKETYGDVTTKNVKTRLGKPVIDYDNGRVTYTEQTFDNQHIFTFEFLDDEFKDLQYFSIDG